MNKLTIGMLMGALFCGLCLAQQTPSSEASQQDQQTPTPPDQSNAPATADAPRIAPASVIPVELTTTIDAKKAQDGDEVEARVTQDLKSGTGQIVVAKDTKVVGHITEAQARGKDQPESQIGIAFDHVVMKDGTVSALPMSIQAIIAHTNQGSENDNSGGAGVGSTTSASVPGMPGSSVGGRSGQMGSGASQPPAGSYPSSSVPSESTKESSGSRTITADTQGVVGIPNYSLSTAGDSAQGSVVTSEKGNVRLESGTWMLLRVNQ